MTTKIRNERQAHQLLAKTAGAAQVARMADGTLACSGRDGQLAEPIEYRVDTAYQRWHVMHQPWVALVFRGHKVIARGFGDTEAEAEAEAKAAALAKGDA